MIIICCDFKCRILVNYQDIVFFFYIMLFVQNLEKYYNGNCKKYVVYYFFGDCVNSVFDNFWN